MEKNETDCTTKLPAAVSLWILDPGIFNIFLSIVLSLWPICSRLPPVQLSIIFPLGSFSLQLFQGFSNLDNEVEDHPTHSA